MSQYLRSHNGSSFKWKDYSPLVFQRLRQLFGIDNMDYLLSLTGDTALRLLASPGKSGSAFFLSEDDRFLIKTVQQEELRLLLELIPKYYRHVEDNAGTLLTRFHGLHMVKPVGRAKATALARVRAAPLSTSTSACYKSLTGFAACCLAHIWHLAWKHLKYGNLLHLEINVELGAMLHPGVTLITGSHTGTSPHSVYIVQLQCSLLLQSVRQVIYLNCYGIVDTRTA